MDVRLINPFIAATRKMFSVFANTEVHASPARATRRLPSAPGSVNAVVQMSGGATGALLIRFPMDLVMPIAQLLDPTAEALQDGLDAVGEIANIVTGNAKRKLTRRIVEITVPEIVIDRQGLRRLQKLTPWLIVPMACELGSFQLAVSYRVTNKKPELSASPSVERSTA